MLQAIRSKATSFVIKILFAMLIISFGVWGIGDIFRNRGADTTVVTVGDRAISAGEVSEAVRARMDQLRNLLGDSLTTEQAKQMGVVDEAVERLVGTDLVDLEAQRLHLQNGDDAVREAILTNPNFLSEAGIFDRLRYAAYLRANNKSEAQFEAEVRRDLARLHLMGALVDGLAAPKVLTDTLYRIREERRIAEVLTLPPSAAGTLPAPTEDEVKGYYDQHQDRFQTAELRSFRVAMLRLDDVAKDIPIPEEELQNAYKERQEEFHVPETRHVAQIPFPDEAKAKEAKAKLAAGGDFYEIARENNVDQATLDVGWIHKDDPTNPQAVPLAVVDAAFTLAQGEVSDPVQSAFGWHLVRVLGIKPEETPEFAEVKGKLEKEMQHELGATRIAKIVNDIDDAIAGETPFDDIVKKFELKTTTVEGVDEHGLDAAGKPAAMPEPKAPILNSAFKDIAQGKMSARTESAGNDYYLVAVDTVVPQAAKPLDQVRDEVTRLLGNEQRAAALAKLGTEIAAEVNGGKSLKDAAAAHQLEVQKTEPLARGGATDQVPSSLLAQLFDQKLGTAVRAPAGDGYKVAVAAEIVPADPAKDEGKTKSLAGSLGNEMKSDVVSEFDKALRGHFPVSIDQSKLDRLL